MQIVRVPEEQYKIPKEMLWCLILAMAIVIQYLITIYAVTMRARIKIFNRKFMEQFDDMHRQAFPGQEHAPEFGYPDTGNGFYAKKLPYADWFNFNCAQRCQVNFLEHITFLVLGTIICAFAYPVWALVLQAFIFLGRLLFTIGYSVWGPSGRIPGALIMDLAIFGTFGLMIAAVVKLA